jgi:predicted transposase YdaD
MATLGISKDFWRHTRAFQDILAEGRQEGVELGRQEGRKPGQEEARSRQAGALALRQPERRCGSLDAPTPARIEALSLLQLEELALALLDFRSAQDLRTWLEPLEP